MHVKGSEIQEEDSVTEQLETHVRDVEEDDRNDPFLQRAARVERVDPEYVSRLPGAGAVVGGKYLIHREIGRGGMGVVFAATHRVTGKHVALKWMLARAGRDKEMARRFLREARAAGAINHPSVVTVFDAGMHEGSAYIVMERLQGESLRAVLKGGPLPVGEALRIAQAVIAGVGAAHSQGILHRDLKPDNVFLCAAHNGPPRPKVLDFGMSRLIGTGPELSVVTGPGTVVGTPGYMPLEQLQGKAELDERVDVYAIGVLLYEMLTGRRPYEASTYEALIVQAATVDPESPERHQAGLSPALGAVVTRAIARRPEDRFRDLHELWQGLASAMTGRRGLLSGRRRWVLAAALLLAAGLGLAAMRPGRATVAQERPIAHPTPAAAPSAPAAQPATAPTVTHPPGAEPSRAGVGPSAQGEPAATQARVPAAPSPVRPKVDEPTAPRPQRRAAPADRSARPPDRDRATTLRRDDFF
ncbi:MAG: serine/threonine-protein kinase [Myxococcales bacterium]|nr:serine/threonine-protein kinase [Myxococcales bacterium]